MKKIPSAIVLVLAVLFVLSGSCKKDEDSDHDTNSGSNPNEPPVCIITSPQNGQIYFLGDTVNIEVNASDEDGTIIEVRFYFNDVGVSSVENPPYTYNYVTSNDSLGNHVVKAIAIDNKGIKSSDEVSINITDGKPIPEFSASPNSGYLPLTVEFTNESQNDPTDYLWYFGDGESSTEKDPVHIYNEVGLYTVVLIASNQYGSDTLKKTGCVYVTEEPMGAYTDPRDGQVYGLVEIGGLYWFDRNLNFETVNSWWFDNDPLFGTTFGRLYTWEAALSSCPSGWHLPSDDEWKSLEMGLGISASDVELEGWRGTDEGVRMKATSTWDDSGNGTNSSGFNAVAGGWHDGEMTSNNMGISAVWWTSTSYSTDKAMRRVLRFDNDAVYRGSNWSTLGFSVRCVKLAD